MRFRSYFAVTSLMSAAYAQQRPNIVIFWGDDIGQSNIGAYSHGVMGYKTPNIDRLAKEGIMFTDYYAEQSWHRWAFFLHYWPVRFTHRADESRIAGPPLSDCAKKIRQSPS